MEAEVVVDKYIGDVDTGYWYFENCKIDKIRGSAVVRLKGCDIETISGGIVENATACTIDTISKETEIDKISDSSIKYIKGNTRIKTLYNCNITKIDTNGEIVTIEKCNIRSISGHTRIKNIIISELSDCVDGFTSIGSMFTCNANKIGGDCSIGLMSDTKVNTIIQHTTIQTMRNCVISIVKDKVNIEYLIEDSHIKVDDRYSVKTITPSLYRDNDIPKDVKSYKLIIGYSSDIEHASIVKKLFHMCSTITVLDESDLQIMVQACGDGIDIIEDMIDMCYIREV